MKAQLSPEVLVALRHGERLCPMCLGQKVVENIAVPDFPGDRERYRWLSCPRCHGTGLEVKL